MSLATLLWKMLYSTAIHQFRYEEANQYHTHLDMTQTEYDTNKKYKSFIDLRQSGLNAKFLPEIDSKQWRLSGSNKISVSNVRICCKVGTLKL